MERVSGGEQAVRARGLRGVREGRCRGRDGNISDSIEWVVGGDSALSGTYRGKTEVGQFWAQLATKQFRTEPAEFIAEGDKVVVLKSNSAGGPEGHSVDMLTYDAGGQLVRFETFGGDEVLDQAFPR